jgi:Family of unknown function (DUF6188)
MDLGIGTLQAEVEFTGTNTGLMMMAGKEMSKQIRLSAGPVLDVLRRRVTEASAVAWQLRLGFDNGARVVCSPHPRYEAWAASLPGRPSIFCLPGGDPEFPG